MDREIAELTRVVESDPDSRESLFRLHRAWNRSHNNSAMSTEHPIFKTITKALFQQNEQVLILARFSWVGGAKNHHLLSSYQSFLDVLSQCKASDSVTVLLSHDLIQEGLCDSQFIEKLEQVYREGEDWLILGEDNHCSEDWSQIETTAELREELEDRMNNDVAVLIDPNWLNDDNGITAYLPNLDGTVTTGAY